MTIGGHPGVPTGDRRHLGNGYWLGDDAKLVLRAIRGEVNDEANYRGGFQRAAALTGIAVPAASEALIELARRRLITIRTRG